ncbi:hypothetical protein chiPu_0017378 [Chiloscyllium punctatum]|uniref:Uncharacterized protein n=1 Tax=Chiloscyllium punctatum TaxID=137246 RepID=A0A401RFG7_CHIPU|nr:hypothetical protein [Chiloscyllium punctatum]
MVRCWFLVITVSFKSRPDWSDCGRKAEYVDAANRPEFVFDVPGVEHSLLAVDECERTKCKTLTLESENFVNDSEK